MLTAETYFEGASPRPKKKKDIVDRLLEDNRNDDSFGIEVSDSDLSSDNSDAEDKKTQDGQKNPKSKNKGTDNPTEPPKPNKDVTKPKRTPKPPASKDIDSFYITELDNDPDDLLDEKPKTPSRSTKLGRPPKPKASDSISVPAEDEIKTKRRGRPPSKKKYKDPEDQTTSLSPLKTGAELDLDSAEPKESDANENSKTELANPPIGKVSKPRLFCSGVGEK